MYHLKPLALALTLIGILPGLSSAANIRRDVPSGFNLYAYGDGIGGYPVVYLNGVAHVGRQDQLNSSTPVAAFTLSSSTLIAEPNSTVGGNSGFSNTTFFVPGANASSSQAGFVNGTPPATDVSSGWAFYGQTLLLVDASGQWNTLFSAQSTHSEGIFSLNWNETSDTAIPLTLRLNTPSNTD